MEIKKRKKLHLRNQNQPISYSHNNLDFQLAPLNKNEAIHGIH